MCSLCRDVVQPEVEYDCENERTSGEHTSVQGLSACDQRVGHFIISVNYNDSYFGLFSIAVFFSLYLYQFCHVWWTVCRNVSG